MGYIRSNEDYYRSMGLSPAAARIEGVLADRGISNDEGFCNPIKLRQVDEARADMAAELGIAYPVERSHSAPISNEVVVVDEEEDED